MSFAQRTVAVTGGGRGIGRAVALGFAAAGAKVAIGYRDGVAAAAAVARAIEERGGAARALRVDVADPAAVAEFATVAERELGPCDVLVNNAGILLPGAVLDATVDDWDRTFAVNVRGAWLCSRAFARGMIARGRGAIVNVASISGIVPQLDAGGYSPSKAALISLTQLCAVEWAGAGVRVNAVCPGPVRTDLHEAEYADPALRAARLAAVPAGRAAEPDEVAGAVLYLASDAAGYVTGSCLTVDGGSAVAGFHTVRRMLAGSGGTGPAPGESPSA